MSNLNNYKSFNSDETIKKAVGYKNYLLEKLNEQRIANPSICDMIINVDGHIFHVHKCLMIASSDYFAAMFNSGMQETRASQIELKGVSIQGLREVIDFVYSGELKLSLNNITDVLRSVSHLQVKYALKLCEDYLVDETKIDNCIDILRIAELFSINNLKLEVNRYMLRNFDELVSNDAFLKLNLEQMSYFMQSNKLKLYPEIKVFRACVKWLKHFYDKNNITCHSTNNNNTNHNNSKKYSISTNDKKSPTYQLMQYIRFHTMTPHEFVNIVTKTDIMKEDPQCSDFLIEGYEYFALTNKQYCSSSPRSVIRNEPVMVCVNESMYILNKREESWQYLCQSQATSKTLSQKFVVVNNFLYACGGYSETNRETCDKCHRFDPRTGQWNVIASMNEKRQFFTLAACNEFIVAVGGVYGNIGNFYATIPVSSSLEIYSIENDYWTSITDCNIPILKWPGACIFNKKVFIVGGKLTEGPHHVLSDKSYIIDLSSGEVEVCSSPITTRFNPSVFYSDNTIILFGGEDDKYRLAPCIEIFDLSTKSWSEIATIPVSLSYQCISSTSMIDSKIYYLLEEHDGPSSESYLLKSASFDIKTCQFDTPNQLPHPSILASKWCTLVFPQEFLEKCQVLSNQSDRNNDEIYYRKSTYHGLPRSSTKSSDTKFAENILIQKMSTLNNDSAGYTYNKNKTVTLKNFQIKNVCNKSIEEENGSRVNIRPRDLNMVSLLSPTFSSNSNISNRDFVSAESESDNIDTPHSSQIVYSPDEYFERKN